MNYNVDIVEDTNNVFHYVVYIPAIPNSRSHSPTACGRTFKGMGWRKAAAFAVGDKRGAVHFVRACTACIQKVSDMFDEMETAS